VNRAEVVEADGAARGLEGPEVAVGQGEIVHSCALRQLQQQGPSRSADANANPMNVCT
jgi:hypothetical protein